MDWFQQRPLWQKVGLIFVGLLVVIQVVPYGRAHKNPPVTGEPEWDRPQTRELYMKACGDCHTNETKWPWYAHVAPASWLISRDVYHGREYLNTSEWDQDRKQDGEEAAEQIRSGEMPFRLYTPLHPEARLTEAEKAELIKGMIAMFGDD